MYAKTLGIVFYIFVIIYQLILFSKNVNDIKCNMNEIMRYMLAEHVITLNRITVELVNMAYRLFSFSG